MNNLQELDLIPESGDKIVRRQPPRVILPRQNFQRALVLRPTPRSPFMPSDMDVKVMPGEPVQLASVPAGPRVIKMPRLRPSLPITILVGRQLPNRFSLMLSGKTSEIFDDGTDVAIRRPYENRVFFFRESTRNDILEYVAEATRRGLGQVQTVDIIGSTLCSH